MSTITMIIIITTLSPASPTRHACDEDAARALRRPWAPVVFHGERETGSLPEINARFTPDGDADEAAGFRAVWRGVKIPSRLLLRDSPLAALDFYAGSKSSSEAS